MTRKNVMTERDMDDMFKDISRSKESLAQSIVEQREKEAQESKKKFPFSHHEVYDDDVDLDAMERDINARLELARQGIPITENGIEKTPTLDMVVDLDEKGESENKPMAELPFVMDITYNTDDTAPQETEPEPKAEEKTEVPEIPQGPVTLRDILIDFDADAAEEKSNPAPAEKRSHVAKFLDMLLNLDDDISIEENDTDFAILNVAPIYIPAKQPPVQQPAVEVVAEKAPETPVVSDPEQKPDFPRVTKKPARSVLCVVPCKEKGQFNFAYALTTSDGKQFFCADRVRTSKNVKDQWHLAILKSVDHMMDRIEQIEDDCICVFITNRDAAAFMNRTAAAISQSDVADGNMTFAGKYKKLSAKKTIYFGNTADVKLSSFEDMAIMTANQNIEV